jgi:ankyrin repeat protein
MTSAPANHLSELRQTLDRYRAQLNRFDERLRKLEGRANNGNGGGGAPRRRASLRRRSAAGASSPADRDLLNAIQDGDARSVRAALKAGANSNARDPNGEPALVLAASRGGSPGLVRLLLDAGADVNGADNSGTTALIACARDEDLASVKALVSRGADLNARNREGDTPLTNAAIWGAARVVKYLLAHGADPNLPDGLNISAAELARQKGHRAIVAMLQTASE